MAGGKFTLKLFPAVCSGMTTLPGHAEGTVLAADPLEPFPLPDSALQCLTTCSEGIGCQRTARYAYIYVAQHFTHCVSKASQQGAVPTLLALNSSRLHLSCCVGDADFKPV